MNVLYVFLKPYPRLLDPLGCIFSKPSFETSKPSPEISKPSPEMAAAASAAADSRNRRPLRTFVETLRIGCILERFWFWSA